MKPEMKLVHGLTGIGLHKRMVLYALAFDARHGGGGIASDLRLRNATELGKRTLAIILGELESEGWIIRAGEYFRLAIRKMEANQRVVISAARVAAFSDQPVFDNPDASSSLNRSKKGSL